MEKLTQNIHKQIRTSEVISTTEITLAPISDEFMMMAQQTPADSLPNLIQKLLSGEQPTDIELQQLGDVELAVYMKIKQKKNGNGNNSQTKRPDQLQKMFYKRALKYAEDIFFKKKKNKRINMFYRHHFQEVAEKMGIDILNFYHPNKQLFDRIRQLKCGKKTGQKSFNATYIKLLLNSPSFRAVSRDYLDLFIKQNQRQRKKKIEKLIESCWKIIHNSNVKDHPPLKTGTKVSSDSEMIQQLNQEQQQEDEQQFLNEPTMIQKNEKKIINDSEVKLVFKLQQFCDEKISNNNKLCSDSDQKFWFLRQLEQEKQYKNTETVYAKKKDTKIFQSPCCSLLNKYFLSSKCKIPWSNKQLEEAKLLAYRDLQNLRYIL